MFHSLKKSQVAGIATIQLQHLQDRLAERELKLTLTSSAMDKLVEVGFEPVYGARPLKRAIQQWIENPLAQQILAGKYLPGTEIAVDTEQGEFVFR
ncbi:MAG: ATP-dependent Clp protease ATP-binding subunit ClpB [Neptuniibacter pectenicola]